jgi:hypothetical protein
MQENQRRVPGDTIVPLYDDLAHSDEWQIAGLPTVAIKAEG